MVKTQASLAKPNTSSGVGDYPFVISTLIAFAMPVTPRADMHMHPNAPFGQPFRVKPRAGLMVLFPSWLAHSVNVFYSDTTRISVAFNAQALGFKPGA